MKKLCVMMIAACVLAVSTANTAEAYLLTKQIQGVKKIANLVGKTVKKTADDAGKVVWNNKESIAVATVATVALTNPKAVTAAVSGTADIVTSAVTGTADVAYGVVTNGKTVDTVAPRTNVRQATSSGVIPTVLFYLVLAVLIIVAVRYLLRGAVRKVLPLLVVCILLCCVGVAEAASPAALAPAVKPLAHIAMWVITAITLFL